MEKTPKELTPKEKKEKVLFQLKEAYETKKRERVALHQIQGLLTSLFNEFGNEPSEDFVYPLGNIVDQLAIIAEKKSHKLIAPICHILTDYLDSTDTPKDGIEEMYHFMESLLEKLNNGADGEDMIVQLGRVVDELHKILPHQLPLLLPHLLEIATEAIDEHETAIANYAKLFN